MLTLEVEFLLASANRESGAETSFRMADKLGRRVLG